MRILVTSGPTREPLDPVRYLSNRSSGRMGHSIARALVRLGHEVVLVSGPTELEPPEEVLLVPVETAQDMLGACLRHWPACQGLVAVAAVCDFRPARYSEGKIRRSQGEGLELRLVPNPDVLAALARQKEGRTVVGFALETGDGREAARRKLVGKNLDFVILNGPEAQGAEQVEVLLLDASGGEQAFGPDEKDEVALELMFTVFGAAEGQETGAETDPT